MSVGGVHDMGGVPGYGPVEPHLDQPRQPVFHHHAALPVLTRAGGVARSNRPPTEERLVFDRRGLGA